MNLKKNNPGTALNIIAFDEDQLRIDPLEEEPNNYSQPELAEIKNQEEYDYCETEKKMTYRERADIYHSLRKCLYPRRIIRQEKPCVIDLLQVVDGSHLLLITNLRGLIRHPSSRSQTIVC